MPLAATAAYLSKEKGVVDPWGETLRRKPEKAADGRLETAREFYNLLKNIETPVSLPDIG